jgi:Flp pilus assembly pilin Flp
MRTLRNFLADESARSAIEYGLIVAGIAVPTIAIIQYIGMRLH